MYLDCHNYPPYTADEKLGCIYAYNYHNRLLVGPVLSTSQHTNDMGLFNSNNTATNALKDLARTEKDGHRAQKASPAASLVVFAKLIYIKGSRQDD